MHNPTIKPEPMPCGGVAIFDHASGCAMRCDTCFCVVGSVGMPDHCRELLDGDRALTPTASR